MRPHLQSRIFPFTSWCLYLFVGFIVVLSFSSFVLNAKFYNYLHFSSGQMLEEASGSHQLRVLCQLQPAVEPFGVGLGEFCFFFLKLSVVNLHISNIYVSYSTLVFRLNAVFFPFLELLFLQLPIYLSLYWIYSNVQCVIHFFFFQSSHSLMSLCECGT
jgi:hypothetical protein